MLNEDEAREALDALPVDERVEFLAGAIRKLHPEADQELFGAEPLYCRQADAAKGAD